MLSVLANIQPRNIYEILQLIGIVILVGELLYVSFQKPSEFQKHLLFILTTLAISFIGYFIELVASNEETAFVGICVGYAGKPFALFASLLLLLDYTHIRFPKWLSITILIFYVFLTCIVFTNYYHNLYYTKWSFNLDNIASPFSIDGHGVFWYIYMISAFMIYGAYIGVTIYEFIRSRNKQARRMSVLLFLVIVFSLLGLIGYIGKLTYGYDTTLTGILIGTIFLLVLFTRYRLFDSLSLAQRKTLDDSPNGYVVLDARMQISFYNKTALKLIPELDFRGRKQEENAIKKLMFYQVKNNIVCGNKVYVLSTESATVGKNNKTVGVSYTFTDITEHFNFTEKLNSDIKKATSKIIGIQRQALISFADVVEARDGNTGEHIKSVSRTARLLAEELRKEGKYVDILTDNYIGILEECTPLHDIGKIFIPDTILLKPGKLTPSERKIMETHSEKGKILIETSLATIEEPLYLKTASQIAYYHHEWFDGSGYPTGIKGKRIPLVARIVAVADVYDALRMKRTYKPAFPKTKALSIIKEESGSHFDPDIVNALLHIKDNLN